MGDGQGDEASTCPQATKTLWALLRIEYYESELDQKK